MEFGRLGPKTPLLRVKFISDPNYRPITSCLHNAYISLDAVRKISRSKRHTITSPIDHQPTPTQTNGQRRILELDEANRTQQK